MPFCNKMRNLRGNDLRVKTYKCKQINAFLNYKNYCNRIFKKGLFTLGPPYLSLSLPVYKWFGIISTLPIDLPGSQ